MSKGKENLQGQSHLELFKFCSELGLSLEDQASLFLQLSITGLAEGRHVPSYPQLLGASIPARVNPDELYQVTLEALNLGTAKGLETARLLDEMKTARADST